jgi:secreted protein with Ig-like and vWFA domain
MSLRTDYSGALDVALAAARTAGYQQVTVTGNATISSALITAAGKGQKSFTVNLTLSYDPADLRLEGPKWEAYKSGMAEGLAENDIMSNEYTITLNTSDSVSTSVDIIFSF